MFDYNRAMIICRALSNPDRLRITETLIENPGVNVSKLQELLGLTQPVTSNHLGILRKADIVEMKKDSLYRYYTVKCNDTINLIKSFSK